MPLLKSLLCLKGVDNGRRYLLISILCYLLFVLLSPVLDKAVILLVLLLTVTIPIITATSIRRIHDASLPKSLAFATPLVYWLCVFVITYIKHDLTWLLLILASLVTLATGLLNNARVRKSHQYILGYSGPVDLDQNPNQVSQHQSFHHRIEPTLAVKTSQDPVNKGFQDELSQPVTQTETINTFDITDNLTPVAGEQSLNFKAKRYSEQHPAHTDWYQQFTDWFAINRQVKVMSFISFFVLIMLSVSITRLINSNEENNEVKQPVNNDVVKQRLNKIEMPDNFWVMHDENDAITIGWQGDITKDGDLWSAKTAIGDNQCAEIVFGRDDKFRSLKVIVKNQGDYYADFSPFDSQAIIKAIALKSKFNFCGFEFSLKGTQAKLMNNKKYAAYFDEE